MEMDSMDQEKCAVPHYAQKSKLLNTSSLAKMHLTTCRVPGTGTFDYLYTTNFPHDSNTTVTCLHR
jgi:hypothetical protein